MRRPLPDLEFPLPQHERAATLVNASYIRKIMGQERAALFLRMHNLALIQSSDRSVVAATPTGDILIGYRGAMFAEDRSHNIPAVLRGNLPDFFERELETFNSVSTRFGGVSAVYGYSISGDGMVHELARRGLLNAADEVVTINPLIGPRGAARGIGSNVQIARTIEDYPSGPGLSIGLTRGSIRRSQVKTVRGVVGMDDHNQNQFLTRDVMRGGDEYVRGATPLEERYTNWGMYGRKPNFFSEHIAITNAVTQGLGLAGAGLLVEKIAPNQSEPLKDLEKGVIGGTAASLATQTLIGGGIGVGTLFADVAPIVVGVETYGGVSRALERALPRPEVQKQSVIAHDAIVAGTSAAAATAVGSATQFAISSAATTATAVATGESISLATAAMAAATEAAVATGVGALVAADAAATYAAYEHGRSLWMGRFYNSVHGGGL